MGWEIIDLDGTAGTGYVLNIYNTSDSSAPFSNMNNWAQTTLDGTLKYYDGSNWQTVTQGQLKVWVDGGGGGPTTTTTTTTTTSGSCPACDDGEWENEDACMYSGSGANGACADEAECQSYNAC